MPRRRRTSGRSGMSTTHMLEFTTHELWRLLVAVEHALDYEKEHELHEEGGGPSGVRGPEEFKKTIDDLNALHKRIEDVLWVIPPDPPVQ